MLRILLGLGLGYFYGAKAGRKRYHQIKRGYNLTVNSPVTRKMISFTRKAIARKLDPQPNMREVKNIKTTDHILEADKD